MCTLQWSHNVFHFTATGPFCQRKRIFLLRPRVLLLGFFPNRKFFKVLFCLPISVKEDNEASAVTSNGNIKMHACRGKIIGLHPDEYKTLSGDWGLLCDVISDNNSTLNQDKEITILAHGISVSCSRR